MREKRSNGEHPATLIDNFMGTQDAEWISLSTFDNRANLVQRYACPHNHLLLLTGLRPSLERLSASTSTPHRRAGVFLRKGPNPSTPAQTGVAKAWRTVEQAARLLDWASGRGG